MARRTFNLSSSNDRDGRSTMPRSTASTSSRKKGIPGTRHVASTRRVPTVRAASSHAVAAMAVLQQFRELFRVSQQHFQRVESSCGVSGAQLWALSEVSATPGLTISELARKLSIHLSTSSNLLDKLETQDLIRRERNKQDQRVVRVFITAEGARCLRKAPKPAAGVIPDALRKMSPSALRALKRDLGTLLELASIRSPEEGMKPLAEP